MPIDFILSCLIVASASVLWRNLLLPGSTLGRRVNNLPYLPRRALRCGFCFTYWLALIFVLIFDPLPGWLPVWRFDQPAILRLLTHYLTSWLAVALGAAIIRFSYVSLQELVHWQVHYLNNQPHKHHQPHEQE